MCVRGDLLGVTSLVRALGLQERCYDRLLGLFHSKALILDALTQLWVRLVLSSWLETYQALKIIRFTLASLLRRLIRNVTSRDL